MTAGKRFRTAFTKEYHLPDAGAKALLNAACAALDRIEALEAQVSKDGPLVPGSRGQSAAHPLLASIRAERDSFIRILNALGVDPQPSSASKAGTTLAQRRWGS